MRMSSRLAFAVLSAIGLQSLSIGYSREAAGQSLSSYESLHLEKWTPKSSVRPVQNLAKNGGASFGFNEPLIWRYMQSKGIACADCPTNSLQPATLPVIQSYLDVLSKSGVRVAREIAPERYLSDPANYGLVETVIKEYQKRGFTLVLTVGWPTAHFMGKCLGFGGDDRMLDHAAYEYSSTIARLLIHLQSLPDLDRKWLESNVIIEPWNEFDSLCGVNVGSPEKAARYQGVMQLVFDGARLKNEVLMPSIVNVFQFEAPTAVTGRYGKINSYLSAYYRAGGSGRPNIHLYYDPRWASQPGGLIGVLGTEIAQATQSTPAPYKGALMIGETGAAVQSGVAKCDVNAMKASSQDDLYRAMVKDGAINHGAQAVLFWRLFGLKGLTPEADNCDQFYGMTNDAWPHVENPAEALRSFNKTGADVLNAIEHRR